MLTLNKDKYRTFNKISWQELVRNHVI